MAVGVASRRGSREHNCDAAHVHRADDGTVVAAVVDGVGSEPELAGLVAAVALTIARVGYRRGGLAGLLTAADLLLDEHEAAAVTATVDPDGHVHTHWIGDCRAWWWDGSTLRQITTDHTMGQMLRASGGEPAAQVAATHDHWQRLALSAATPVTVAEVRGLMLAAGQLVLLTSDGVHDALSEDDLTRLAVEFARHPQALADAIVAAVQPDDDGYRDDASVIVLGAR